MGWRATFTIDIGSYVRECLATVRSSLGEGFDHLCDFKSIGVSMHPVLGWVVTIRPSPRQEEKGMMLVDARPVVLTQQAGGRGVGLSASLGFAPAADRLDERVALDAIGGDERMAGVLPAWPGTYYVTGSVNGVHFSLGVHLNPDNRKMVEILLKTYLGWLGSPEARKLKDKLAKPGNTA